MFESGNQRPVAGGGPLKTDILSNGGFYGNFGQIIFAYRVQNACQHLIDGISFRQIIVDVAFHENGAAVAGNG